MKTIEFSLEKNALIIDASLRLHNFNVNSRMQIVQNNEVMSDLDIHRQDITTHRVQNPRGACGIYGGNRRFTSILKEGDLCNKRWKLI